MAQAAPVPYTPKKVGHRAVGGRLSPAQEKFCQTYFATGDMYKAYEDAGYPDVDYRKKRNTCFNLRKKEIIRARLREMAETAFENVLERRGVLVSKLMGIINTDITSLGYDLTKEPIEKRLAIKSIKNTNNGRVIELHDKLKAIELLARITGLLVEKVDITSAGRPIDQTPVQVTFEVVQMVQREPRETTAEVSDENLKQT